YRLLARDLAAARRHAHRADAREPPVHAVLAGAALAVLTVKFDRRPRRAHDVLEALVRERLDRPTTDRHGHGLLGRGAAGLGFVVEGLVLEGVVEEAIDWGERPSRRVRGHERGGGRCHHDEGGATHAGVCWGAAAGTSYSPWGFGPAFWRAQTSVFALEDTESWQRAFGGHALRATAVSGLGAGGGGLVCLLVSWLGPTMPEDRVCVNRAAQPRHRGARAAISARVNAKRTL
ncbi:unnamed protein product, partial [Pelagomonas calceolata]